MKREKKNVAVLTKTINILCDVIKTSAIFNKEQFERKTFFFLRATENLLFLVIIYLFDEVFL